MKIFPVSLRAQRSMLATSNKQISSTNFLVHPTAVVSMLDIHRKQCWGGGKREVVRVCTQSISKSDKHSTENQNEN